MAQKPRSTATHIDRILFKENNRPVLAKVQAPAGNGEDGGGAGGGDGGDEGDPPIEANNPFTLGQLRAQTDSNVVPALKNIATHLEPTTDPRLIEALKTIADNGARIAPVIEQAARGAADRLVGKLDEVVAAIRHSGDGMSANVPAYVSRAIDPKKGAFANSPEGMWIREAYPEVASLGAFVALGQTAHDFIARMDAALARVPQPTALMKDMTSGDLRNFFEAAPVVLAAITYASK